MILRSQPRFINFVTFDIYAFKIELNLLNNANDIAIIMKNKHTVGSKEYNNTEDIPSLCRRRVLSDQTVGVQSPTEREPILRIASAC